MDQTQQQPTPKQQISELLRTGSNFIVVTPSNPTVDQAAAALGLTNLLRKVNKNAQGVALGKVPKEIDFLPSYTLASKPEAQRDFLIELDTSKTEADKLKYTTEGKKLKVYITPFNGNFTKDDVSFSYGDYHVDAVVALGVTDPAKLAEQFGEDKELINKAKVITINNHADAGAGGALAWNEDTSSLSEMVMSMSEALQSGILDKEIATILLTGIIFATDHFRAPNTTPKVMTMAAQLMAAGADQAHIMKQLEKSKADKPKPKPAKEAKTDKTKEKKEAKPDDSRIEMKPAEESSLKGHDPASLGISGSPDGRNQEAKQADKPDVAPKSDQSQNKPQVTDATDHKPELKVEPPHPQAQKEAPKDKPLSPFMAHQFGADANAQTTPQAPGQQSAQAQQPSPNFAPAPTNQGSQQPPAPQAQSQQRLPTQAQPESQPQAPQPPSQSDNVDAARRAVEEAAQASGDTHQQLRSHYSVNDQNQQAPQQPGAAQPNNQPPQFPPVPGNPAQ